ncbi:hypothetical protein EXIGLDRAFT_762733 [Exidia glandulosa HHB12029]|uniref:CCHC-type domain-containing protein n=1 Tax=Exidia glandulosa HHB12029 TaxID=1314781 RepID=A0A165MFJ9_EXIGL|nr:hypothetical protein EXIGLDRAFT_762733 [Exidia glandulosa HHB12029]
MDADTFANSIKTALTDTIRDLASDRGSKNHAERPDHFDGHRTNYGAFRRNLLLYVQAIRTDNEKIVTALSFLTKGDADAWAQLYVQQYTDDLESSASKLKWTDFLAELDKRFLDPRITELAREKLFRMTQGRAVDAETFLATFEDLRIKGGLVNAEHHDTILVDYLKKAMWPELVLVITTTYDSSKTSALATIDTLKMLKTLNEADYDKAKIEIEKPISYAKFKEYALEHATNVQRFASRVQNTPTVVAPRQTFERRVAPQVVYQPPPGPPPQQVQQTATPPRPSGLRQREPDVIPMDVDRTRARNEGRCFKCDQKGHIARDCKARELRHVVRALSNEAWEELAEMRRADATANATTSDEGFAPPQ